MSFIFVSVHAQPPALTAVLLLDITTSMADSSLALDPRYAQVYNSFQQGLRPEDRAAVGVIARPVRFTAMGTDRRDMALSLRRMLQLPDAVRRGPSPLWDAIDQAMDLMGDAGGRSAIVLFSDGKAAGNRRGLDEVVERARARRVSVSVVVEGAASLLLARSPLTLDPADNIERLTSSTGGKRLLDRPPDPRQRNPGPLISLIMDGLRQ